MAEFSAKCSSAAELKDTLPYKAAASAVASAVASASASAAASATTLTALSLPINSPLARLHLSQSRRESCASVGQGFCERGSGHLQTGVRRPI